MISNKIKQIYKTVEFDTVAHLVGEWLLYKKGKYQEIGAVTEALLVVDVREHGDDDEEGQYREVGHRSRDALLVGLCPNHARVQADVGLE